MRRNERLIPKLPAVMAPRSGTRVTIRSGTTSPFTSAVMGAPSGEGKVQRSVARGAVADVFVHTR